MFFVQAMILLACSSATPDDGIVENNAPIQTTENPTDGEGETPVEPKAIPTQSGFTEIVSIPNEIPRPLNGEVARLSEMIIHADFQDVLDATASRTPEDDDWVDVQYHRGLAFTALGKPAEALECFQLAIAKEPSFTSAHWRIAWNFVFSKRCGDALPHLDKIIELQPETGPHYYNRGHCRFYTKDLKGALQDAEVGCTLGYKPSCDVAIKMERRTKMNAAAKLAAEHKESLKNSNQETSIDEQGQMK